MIFIKVTLIAGRPTTSTSMFKLLESVYIPASLKKVDNLHIHIVCCEFGAIVFPNYVSSE